ncbi:MAG: hypothetical protein U0793_09920 [Gemmataceae bacterium]
MNRALVLFFAVLAGPLPAWAQDKKKDKKVEPHIALLVPLGAPPGKTTKITVRGWRLDQAMEVRASDGATAKIVSKGGAAVPDKNPEKVGDTQVIVEVTVPAKLVADRIDLTVVTPDGVSKGRPLLIEQRLPVVPEKEPNPGFKESQAIEAPVVVEGTVSAARDVDVFRLVGKKGRKLRAEALAARYGSPLDALLSLYDERGELVAHAAAEKAGADPRLEIELPGDGVFFLVLSDAHDSGSPLHVYRLVVEVK